MEKNSKSMLYASVSLSTAMILAAGGVYLSQKVKKKHQSNTRVYHVGAVELGGTNINFSIVLIEQNITTKAYEKYEVIESGHCLTEKNPMDSLNHVIQFFNKHPVKRIGVTSFGPIIINKDSPDYGRIISPPSKQKLGWKDFNLYSCLKNAFPSAKLYITTDVIAPAYAEFLLGKHKAKENLVYVTVGTGVGIGVICNKKPILGLLHPEGGHITISPVSSDKHKSTCIFHEFCVEGYVNNNSIALRKKIDSTDLDQIPDSDEVWEIIGDYLAQFCVLIEYAYSTETIVWGGGVMKRKILFDIMKKKVPEKLDYPGLLPLYGKELVNELVKECSLGDKSAQIGAALLSLQENQKQPKEIQNT